MGYRALLRDLLNGHYEHCGGEKQTLDVFEEALGWAGYCIVSLEPTDSQTEAGADALERPNDIARDDAAVIYRAMIRSRPKD